MKSEFWLTLVLLAGSAVCLAAEEPRAPFEVGGEVVPRGKIDECVLERLKILRIEPAYLCSDEVFLRRVYLDVIGTLPTVEEARAFLADKSPEKRQALIDRLLERPEFADYWAMKWSDLLRVKAEFPINLWPNAVQAYHRWIQTSIKQNVSCDQFARELLTASGSNFRVPQVNFYRAVQSREPKALAQAAALTFMGVRPETWKPEELEAMALFFSQISYKSTGEWKEEIIFFDTLKQAGDPGTNGEVAKRPAPVLATLPDGQTIEIPRGKDPRVVFADWLTNPRNPWFARNMVNRVWYWLQGRGIVHEPDDSRPQNPPSNPRLLDYLAGELVASKYDLKHIFRLILNSATYQLSSIPRSDHPHARANFAAYSLRRLDAEVLIDALCQITGTTEEYSSPIPEPFTFIPPDQRSIALADGSISSSFLELFGRPPRDTGLESERNNRPTPAQRLHLLNSSHIQQKLQRSAKLQTLMRASDTRQSLNSVYLAILSRYPTEQEAEVIRDYTQADTGARGQALFDIAWALVNSAEFLYRH